MVLCSPIMGLHVNPDHSISFLWERLVALGIGIFFASLAWDWYFSRVQTSAVRLQMPRAVSDTLALFRQKKTSCAQCVHGACKSSHIAGVLDLVKGNDKRQGRVHGFLQQRFQRHCGDTGQSCHHTLMMSWGFIPALMAHPVQGGVFDQSIVNVMPAA